MSHATTSTAGGHTRVLVVRKTGGSSMLVQVCADPTKMDSSGWPTTPSGGVAQLTELVGSEGLENSATVGELTLGGQTLKGSLDGNWRGSRETKELVARQGGGEEVCFDVHMTAYSAAMLVVMAHT